MKLTIEFDGEQMPVNEALHKALGKAKKPKMQDVLEKNIEKGKTAEPMQSVMPRKLDEKARKGAGTPTKKQSAEERLNQFRKGGSY